MHCNNICGQPNVFGKLKKGPNVKQPSPVALQRVLETLRDTITPSKWRGLAAKSENFPYTVLASSKIFW